MKRGEASLPSRDLCAFLRPASVRVYGGRWVSSEVTTEKTQGRSVERQGSSLFSPETDSVQRGKSRQALVSCIGRRLSDWPSLQQLQANIERLAEVSRSFQACTEGICCISTHHTYVSRSTHTRRLLCVSFAREGT